MKRQHICSWLNVLWIIGDHKALFARVCGVSNVPGDGSPSTWHFHIFMAGCVLHQTIAFQRRIFGKVASCTTVKVICITVSGIRTHDLSHARPVLYQSAIGAETVYRLWIEALFILSSQLCNNTVLPMMYAWKYCTVLDLLEDRTSRPWFLSANRQKSEW